MLELRLISVVDRLVSVLRMDTGGAESEEPTDRSRQPTAKSKWQFYSLHFIRRVASYVVFIPVETPVGFLWFMVAFSAYQETWGSRNSCCSIIYYLCHTTTNEIILIYEMHCKLFKLKCVIDPEAQWSLSHCSGGVIPPEPRLPLISTDLIKLHWLPF